MHFIPSKDIWVKPPHNIDKCIYHLKFIIFDFNFYFTVPLENSGSLLRVNLVHCYNTNMISTYICKQGYQEWEFVWFRTPL